ncbi:MAG TPA: hypothetical protein VHC48_19195, partial [Puia sp.]|nr:hypothetical protein [Puia sp.]
MAQQPPAGPPSADTTHHPVDTLKFPKDSLHHPVDTLKPPRMAPGNRAAPRPPKPPAASLSNLHRKYIPVRGGHIPIDSAGLVPGAFFPKDVSDSDYVVDWVNGTLTWVHPPAGRDSILVVYRSLPYRLNAPARHFNYDSIESHFLAHPYVFNSGAGGMGNDNFFNFGNITYNGSFGRSITFGNSQDAVVTSNLNLQISGYLADSIEISAAITDNNIPIQPDGTTANLNEF